MAEWLDEVRARVDAFEKPPKSPEKVKAASRLMVAAVDDTPRLLRCAEALERLVARLERQGYGTDEAREAFDEAEAALGGDGE